MDTGQGVMRCKLKGVNTGQDVVSCQSDGVDTVWTCGAVWTLDWGWIGDLLNPQNLKIGIQLVTFP